MIPKKLHEVWHETEAQAKRRVNAWPMLICRIGEADLPSLARIQAFFNRRGFNALVQDFRMSADVELDGYKFVFFVARTMQEAVSAVRPRERDLSITNSVIFTDSELEGFLDWAEPLKARSHVIGAIALHKIARQQFEKEVFFSKRSLWFQKEAQKERARYKEWANSVRRKAEPKQEMLAGYVEEGARSEEFVELLKDTVPYVLFAGFLVCFAVWIVLVGRVSLYWISAVGVALAALNLLRPVPGREE